MNRAKYSFVLDVQSTEAQICLVSSVGDTSREMNIRLSDGGVPLPLVGNEKAVLFIEGPGGTINAACSLEKDGQDGYYILYIFTKETCAMEGLHKCQLWIYEEASEGAQDGPELWSPQFSMFVGPKKKRPGM